MKAEELITKKELNKEEKSILREEAVRCDGEANRCKKEFQYYLDRYLTHVNRAAICSARGETLCLS